jgi:hypothetical protein
MTLQQAQRRYDAATDEDTRYDDRQQEMLTCWGCREVFASDDMVDGYSQGPVCQDCDLALAEGEMREDEQ